MNCPIFPRTNVWNTRVDGLPRAANSARWIGTIGSSTGLHPDFGSYAGYGIPFNVVPGTQPKKRVRFQYASESDPGPYPIPRHAKIEAGSDRHLLIVDQSRCRLYALRRRAHVRGLACGVRGRLGSRVGPPAAGRMDECRRGRSSDPARPRALERDQARRDRSCPPLHRAPRPAAGTPTRPAMTRRPTRTAGAIRRWGCGCGYARASGSPASPGRRIIAVALKRYGMILADNGSPWYISGASNAHFNDAALHKLDRITGADMVVVDTSHLRNG